MVAIYNLIMFEGYPLRAIYDKSLNLYYRTEINMEIDVIIKHYLLNLERAMIMAHFLKSTEIFRNHVLSEYYVPIKLIVPSNDTQHRISLKFGRKLVSFIHIISWICLL